MQIRKMTGGDEKDVLSMMEVFYTSPAVSTDGSEEIFRNDFAQCIGGNPFLSGFILEDGGKIAGYAMLAHSFSTEFGKPCVWVEDLYLKPEARGKGYGPVFLSFVREHYPDSVFRLEVETENIRAVRAYRKSGFGTLPYTEMIHL